MSEGFLALRNRYLLRGVLEACAPMHVGSGFEDMEAGSDSGFIRDAGGVFVPGSSIRGVLRSTLERIVQALGDPKRGCVLFETGTHPSCPTALADRDPLKKRLQEMTDDRALVGILLGDDGLCDVCRLFGSPFMASKVRFRDSRPRNGQARLNKRDGVGIDRDTEAARDKIKFDFMALERYTGTGTETLELGFELELENADDSDLALLGIVLHELIDRGVNIGGKKARGFGQVKLRSDYAVDYFADRASLRSFLLTGALQRMSGAEFTATLLARIDGYIAKYFSEVANVQAER